MPINGTLDKENVVHIYLGILCNYTKKCDRVLCENTGGAGGHYTQQTNTGRENQIWNVLTSGSQILQTRGHIAGNSTYWGLSEGGGWEEGEDQKNN